MELGGISKLGLSLNDLQSITCLLAFRLLFRSQSQREFENNFHGIWGLTRPYNTTREQTYKGYRIVLLK